MSDDFAVVTIEEAKVLSHEVLAYRLTSEGLEHVTELPKTKGTKVVLILGETFGKPSEADLLPEILDAGREAMALKLSYAE